MIKMQTNKTCPVCNTLGHSKFYCKSRPRKPIKANKPLPSPSKPIAKIGKTGKATNSAVAKWKRTQKPNYAGYWECYICHRLVTYLMAEHVKSKARSPESRTDADNFRPVCAECNKKKGSISL